MFIHQSIVYHHMNNISKSSSLNHMISDDEMSNASTIKNAKFSRDEISISNYDTVLREVANIFLVNSTKDNISLIQVTEFLSTYSFVP